MLWEQPTQPGRRQVTFIEVAAEHRRRGYSRQAFAPPEQHLEAQGDIFTTAGVAPFCNVQAYDEVALGLQAPNLAAPGVAPSDDVDALSEIVPAPGLCTVGGLVIGPIPNICPAFSLTALSGSLLGVLPALM